MSTVTNVSLVNENNWLKTHINGRHVIVIERAKRMEWNDIFTGLAFHLNIRASVSIVFPDSFAKIPQLFELTLLLLLL